MCLITKQKKPFIAEEDITVYKVLEDGLKSPFNRYNYKLGSVNKTKIRESYEWCCFDDVDTAFLDENHPGWKEDSRNRSGLRCYGHGYHSATTKERLKSIVQYYGRIYKCIIPAGSKYYLGNTDLCVSDMLIVVRKVSNRIVAAEVCDATEAK
jgi:hypothetical protein